MLQLSSARSVQHKHEGRKQRTNAEQDSSDEVQAVGSETSAKGASPAGAPESHALVNTLAPHPDRCVAGAG